MNLNDSSPSVSTETLAPATEPVATTTPGSDPQPNSDVPASPSDAPQGESKESLLEAVMKVVKPSEDADKLKLDGDTPAPNEPQSDTTEDGTAGAEDEISDEPSDEEMARYHSRTRKRINQLLSKKSALEQEVQSLRAEATTTQGLRSFLSQSGISREEFTQLLDVGAALKNGSPDELRRAHSVMAHIMQRTEEALGMRLPQDLAQRVQQGHMTTEAARVYQQERYARQMAEAEAMRNATVLQDQQVQQHIVGVQDSIRSAVGSWEMSVRQTDPDYGTKEKAVQELMHAVINEYGAPTNAQHAVQIAQEAYNRANRLYSQFTPRPRATAPVPSSVNRSTGASPEPRSLMEAMTQGLQRSRRTA